MTRLRAIASAALAAGLLAAAVGRLGGPPTPAYGDESEAASAREWGRRRPDASLVLVGGQGGRLEPPSCAAARPGGLARLAALVERLRLRPAAPERFSGLSLGWTMAGLGEPQEESKAVLYRAALRELGFGGTLLGPPDLRVSAMVQPFPGAADVDVPHPPLNVALADGSPAASTSPFADLRVGGRPLRAFSVVDPEDAQRLVEDGLAKGFVGCAAALQALQERPETLWLVAARLSSVEEEALLAGVRRLGPAVVVDLSGGRGAARVDGARLLPKTGRPPVVVSLPDGGRGAGILDVDPAPDGGWSITYRTLDLVPELDAAPSPLRDRLAAELLARYADDVRAQGFLERFETIPYAGGLRYLGSGACARCHPGIYEQWVGTPHAAGLKTIRERGRERDPDCVRCHVVGFERFGDGRWRRTTGGFRDPERTQHLGGVGCESCHGPGSAHVANPADVGVWGPGRPNRRHPGVEGCAKCHDADNSPDFRGRYEGTYLPAADHRSVPFDRRTVRPAGPR